MKHDKHNHETVQQRLQKGRGRGLKLSTLAINHKPF